MKFGFIKINQPLTSPSIVSSPFVNQFVRYQLLNGASMVGIRHFEFCPGVQWNWSMGNNKFTWVLQVNPRGVFKFNTDFAMRWYSTQYSRFSVEPFFNWLIIECLSALRASFTSGWSASSGNFINHRHLEGFLSGEDLAVLREGNASILDNWKNLPDREASGKSLLQQIDRWTLQFMFSWILRRDPCWINEPEWLALLIKDPVSTIKIMIASKFSLSDWLNKRTTVPSGH